MLSGVHRTHAVPEAQSRGLPNPFRKAHPPFFLLLRETRSHAGNGGAGANTPPLGACHRLEAPSPLHKM
jgi:hypothetical protein